MRFREPMAALCKIRPTKGHSATPPVWTEAALDSARSVQPAAFLFSQLQRTRTERIHEPQPNTRIPDGNVEPA